MNCVIRTILVLLVLGCSKKEEPAPGASIKLRYEPEGGVTLEAVSLNASDFSGVTYSKLWDGVHKFRAVRRGASPKEVTDTVRVMGGICVKKEIHF